MKHAVTHRLDHQLARQATHRAAQYYRQTMTRFSPRVDWQDPDHARVVFSAKGLTVEADVEVTDTEIRIDVDVPFLLRPFEGRATRLIDAEIRKWIGRAKNGRFET